MSGIDHNGLAAHLADDEALSYDAQVIGESELGRRTSKALRAFTKASRACLLYDYDNRAVAEFLEDLDARLHKALRHGPIELDVQPWELLREGEVVYRENDREKSLAYRLYRDGIRRLIIRPDVSWDEITRLVGILSIRFSDIRQQEEDVVTMLWRADFEHIEVEAVESYTPVDDESTNGSSSAALKKLENVLGRNHGFEPPGPELGEWAEVEYRSLPSEQLRTLLEEDDSAQLARQCQQLVARLLLLVIDPQQPMEVLQVVPLVRDVRDFLLAEGLDDELQKVVRLVHRAVRHLDSQRDRNPLLGVFTDPTAFARMVDAAIESEMLPDSLVEIAAAAPESELEAMLTVLASRWTGAGREVGRELMAAGLGDRITQLGSLITGAAGVVAADLLELAAERDPEFAGELALTMVQRDDRPTKIRSLRLLQKLPYRSEIGRVLTQNALTSDDAEVRCRAAAVLALKGEKRSFESIKRLIQQRVEGGGDSKELSVLGEALAWLDSDRAREVFREWVQPQGLLDKIRSAPSAWWIPAIAGLARIPGQESAELLRWLEGRAEGKWRSRCSKALAAQQSRAAGGGGG